MDFDNDRVSICKHCFIVIRQNTPSSVWFHADTRASRCKRSIKSASPVDVKDFPAMPTKCPYCNNAVMKPNVLCGPCAHQRAAYHLNDVLCEAEHVLSENWME